MGKKARKTRWRTLSIGEGPSDSESQAGDGAKPRGRWGQGGTAPGTQQRYTSSHSTSTRHHNHRYNGIDSTTKWGPGNRAPHVSVSTRSSSTASEHKITFNEDEYTKITTPRQDVLFKKGYLSKPKPHLQRPLTSAGNSTGDGTPDHQSADGADYPENDFDNVFPYPTGAYDPSLYYLNTYDPVGPNTVQPVLLYDQFGNAAFCYPHAGLHPTYPPNNNNNHSGAKRYSVDSLTTESPSPNNEETCSAATETEEVEEEEEEEEEVVFLPVEEEASSSDAKPNENEEESDEEKKLRKKRRRRKSEQVSPEQVKVKYSVDAEEFIPRGFVSGPPQLGYVPLLPHEVFPGGFVLLPAPPQFYPVPPPPFELDDEQIASVGPIDIAKIVSKLEEAAREQKQELQNDETVPVQQNNDDTKPTEVEVEVDVEDKVEELPKNELEEVVPVQVEIKAPETTITNKTEVTTIRPMAARYADRLKTTQQQQASTKPATTSAPGAPHKQRATPSKPRHVPASGVCCPRLERTATTVSKPTPASLAPSMTSDWISVSGKKKRKSNQKQTTSDITDTVLPTLKVSSPETTTTTTTLPITPPILVTEVPELISEPTNIEKTPKSKEKPLKITSTKKQTKKRIIITDGALQNVPVPAIETPSCSPAPVVPMEQAANCNLGEKDKTTSNNKEPEIVKTPIIPEVLVVPEIRPVSVTPEVSKQQEPTKKQKKKNKNKSKLSTSTCSLGQIGTESPPLYETSGAHQDDDMSLELDRMIQRGLYANLEQKLQNYNPDDSFLATLGRSAPNILSKATPTLLPFPPLILPPQTPSSSPSPPATTEPASTGPGGAPGLSITQAVREWMDRTREATPEVEIFRRPQELREEVLLAIEDLDLGNVKSDDEVEEVEDEEDEEEVDRSALDAASLLDARTRSRSGSVDLLQCWEYDVPVPAQHMAPVEAAEDALESYESVYGQSGEFHRTQGLRTRPRGDGGLPYRAICCTVM